MDRPSTRPSSPCGAPRSRAGILVLTVALVVLLGLDALGRGDPGRAGSVPFPLMLVLLSLVPRMIPLVERSPFLARSAPGPTAAVFFTVLGIALAGTTASTVLESPSPSFLAAGLVLVLGTASALAVPGEPS